MSVIIKERTLEATSVHLCLDLTRNAVQHTRHTGKRGGFEELQVLGQTIDATRVVADRATGAENVQLPATLENVGKGQVGDGDQLGVRNDVAETLDTHGGIVAGDARGLRKAGGARRVTERLEVVGARRGNVRALVGETLRDDLVIGEDVHVLSLIHI